MAFAGNGTTVVVGSGLLEAEVVSVSFDQAAAEIDVTNMDDTAHIFEAGIPDETLTVEINGLTALPLGKVSTGVTATITWGGAGTPDTLDNVVITNISTSTDIDGKITSSLTFKRGQ